MKIKMITEALAHTIAERKEAEVKEKALKDELLKEMLASGEEVEETPNGKFSIARRKYYEYPEEITEAELALKIKKLDAQEQGLCEMTVKEYILFKELTM